jgi:hypothetical protein
MSKLKSYEIDAIVYTIQNQIKEINNNARRDELDPAEAKIAELIKQEKEACAALDKLRKARQELSNELGKELNAFYCTTTNRFIARTSNALGLLEIRNRLIISQINPDSNIEQFIKNIVEEFTK